MLLRGIDLKSRVDAPLLNVCPLMFWNLSHLFRAWRKRGGKSLSLAWTTKLILNRDTKFGADDESLGTLNVVAVICFARIRRVCRFFRCALATSQPAVCSIYDRIQLSVTVARNSDRNLHLIRDRRSLPRETVFLKWYSQNHWKMLDKPAGYLPTVLLSIHIDWIGSIWLPHGRSSLSICSLYCFFDWNDCSPRARCAGGNRRRNTVGPQHGQRSGVHGHGRMPSGRGGEVLRLWICEFVCKAIVVLPFFHRNTRVATADLLTTCCSLDAILPLFCFVPYL